MLFIKLYNQNFNKKIKNFMIRIIQISIKLKTEELLKQNHSN